MKFEYGRFVVELFLGHVDRIHTAQDFRIFGGAIKRTNLFLANIFYVHTKYNPLLVCTFLKIWDMFSTLSLQYH